MTVLKRRTRIISFRLFENEYQELQNICVSEGVRSLSDLARSAVCHLIRSGGKNLDETLEEELWKLKGRMEGLDCELKRLGEIIGGAPNSHAPKRAKAAGTP